MEPRPPAVPRTLICDFCGIPEKGPAPTHVVPARAFSYDLHDVQGRQHMSSEDWLACGDCAALIDAGRWEKLLQRALESQTSQHPKPHPAGYVLMLTKVIGGSYAKLRANRNGPIRELTPDDVAAILRRWPNKTEIREFP